MRSSAAAVTLIGLLLNISQAARKVKAASSRTTALDPDHITCPVLAALWRAGDLNTDDEGNAEIKDIFDALHYGIGVERNLSLFQAFGIVGFPKHQKNSELIRDRCIPYETPTGTSCFVRRFMGQLPVSKQEYPLMMAESPQEADESTMRYLNIFKMNGNQVVEHGISSGVRGGGVNMPPGVVEVCQGKFPCQALYDKFFTPAAQPDGRFYTENIMKTICLLRKFGDRGGEHSHNAGEINLPLTPPELTVVASEWQAKGALTAMVHAFGEWDEKRQERYLTKERMQALFFDGRYPDGWTKRSHGCIYEGCDFPAITRMRTPVPCDVEAETGQFWKDSGCNVRTGVKCEDDGDCGNEGRDQCYYGYCTCARHGFDGSTMCYSPYHGKCKPQYKIGNLKKAECTFLGSKCEFKRAVAPIARGNFAYSWDEVIVGSCTASLHG